MDLTYIKTRAGHKYNYDSPYCILNFESLLTMTKDESIRLEIC